MKFQSRLAKQSIEKVLQQELVLDIDSSWLFLDHPLLLQNMQLRLQLY